MMIPRRRPLRSRGNLLAMALAFMAVLMTLVVGMHASQSRANRTVTQAEAELQFRQAAEFETAQLLQGSFPPPDSLRVQADSELVSDEQMPDQYATKVWETLPDWKLTGEQDYPPGHRTYQIQPTTRDQSLNVFADKFLWLVTHNHGGYAVYAPQGRVSLEEGRGWGNPSFSQELGSTQQTVTRRTWYRFGARRRTTTVTVQIPNDPREVVSGVPFFIGAGLDVTVARLGYGEAHSLKGPIDLGSVSSDLGIAYQGSLPLRRYETSLRRQLEQARNTLVGIANSGDKTDLVHRTAGPLPASQAYNLLTQGAASDLPWSLDHAMAWPLPGFAGWANPGANDALAEAWLHLPDAPDLFDGNLVTPDIFGAGASANDLLQASQAALDLVRDNLQLEEPSALRQDDVALPDTGPRGWSYQKLFAHLPEIMAAFASEGRASLSATLASPVRLLHFGAPDRPLSPGFKFQDGWSVGSTLTVPRGRPLKYRGRLEITGDLWLQKGSLMHVTGDLVLRDPGKDPLSSLAPSGKLILEPGATLIVDGSLQCAGRPNYGSLWTCGPLNQVSPITSAILVQGDASFPHGSYSASSLEDMAAAIEGLERVSHGLNALLQQTAPNLAKIAGPFHYRQPYLASFATTFEMRKVGGPQGQRATHSLVASRGSRSRYISGGRPSLTTLVFPLPRPVSNVSVVVFRALSTSYAVMTNASLGEHFYPQADWWGLGQGLSAAAPKLSPKGVLKNVMNVQVGQARPYGDWQEELDSWVSQFARPAAEFAATEIALRATEGVGTGTDERRVEELHKKVTSLQDDQDRRRKSLEREVWGNVQDDLKRMMTNMEQEVRRGLAEAYLREVVGPLIYARSISVGSFESTPRLMSGMLVAHQRLSVQSQVFVGSLTSLEGDIEARKVYFTPVFTRASLAQPEVLSASPSEQAVLTDYGPAASPKAIDIGTGVQRITTEGWSH